MTTTDEPRPGGFLDVLDQDQFWWTKDGRCLRLEDMGPRHKRNTLAFIRRQDATWSLLIAVSALDAGEMASDEVIRGMSGDWLEDMPLVVRLAALVAADKTAGVPDEPDERVGKPLPCAHWCLICAEEGPITVPGAPLPCDRCHDCTWELAAADDATWD